MQLKIVQFDLGKTLESDVHGVLLPGALEVLETLFGMTDGNDQPIFMALCSDFTMPSSPGSIDQIQGIREEYYVIIEQLGIRRYFEPVESRITLSTEVGVFKPDPKIFRAALDKIDPGVPFADAMFITEKLSHVLAARNLGMEAIHFKGPGQLTGEVNKLPDLVPLIKSWLFGH